MKAVTHWQLRNVYMNPWNLITERTSKNFWLFKKYCEFWGFLALWASAKQGDLLLNTLEHFWIIRLPSEAYHCVSKCSLHLQERWQLACHLFTRSYFQLAKMWCSILLPILLWAILIQSVQSKVSFSRFVGTKKSSSITSTVDVEALVNQPLVKTEGLWLRGGKIVKAKSNRPASAAVSAIKVRLNCSVTMQSIFWYCLALDLALFV